MTVQCSICVQQGKYYPSRRTIEGNPATDVACRTRTGKKEVLEKLGEGNIGPDQFRMRLHLTFETGDEKYTWLNSGVFMASSGRVGDMVIYDAYQVL